MFKAKNSQNDEDIVILDSKWSSQVNHLRNLDKKDILVCPGCHQPVRVRAGQKKRWHFAHKHLQACPLSHESAIVLETRAVLYEWLVSKFKDEIVTIEQKLGEELLSRPIDCWVETKSGNFGYWLIPSQIKPDDRENLKLAFEREDVKIHWVFLSDMLREVTSGGGDIYLTTTEREFKQQSQYDEFIDHHGGLHSGRSLHYLDAAKKKLITFRSLLLFHSPQVYSGRKRISKMADLLVHPKTGEFVHLGEHKYWKQTKERREKLKKEEEERERRWRESLELSNARRHDFPDEVDALPGLPGVCVLCGETKTEWGFITQSGTRICKECYEG